MAKNETFDRDEYYSGINSSIAIASSGRASRISAPLLEEEKTLLEKERAVFEEEKKKFEEEKAAKKDIRPPEQESASYRIGQELKVRISEAANSYNVKKAGFVKALLIYALDELEAGSWNLPPATGKRELDI